MASISNLSELESRTLATERATNDEAKAFADQLLQRQGGVTVRYWCEKGRFRP